MSAALKKVLTYVSPFDDTELDRITALFHPRSCRRNETILREGETCTAFYLVQAGSIRTYFIDKKGIERTRYIMLDNWIGTALTSFITQQPSFECIEAMEDSQLLYISHKDFFELNEQLPNWKRFYQRILEMAYAFQNKKIESLVTLSAKERYQQVLAENPAMIQRVSNKILASYLDINPETLSRLKSR